MSAPQPEPGWWPDGADEALVRDCNCDRCGALVEALEDHRQGVAVDGEHATLSAYSEGGEPA